MRGRRIWGRVEFPDPTDTPKLRQPGSVRDGRDEEEKPRRGGARTDGAAPVGHRASVSRHHVTGHNRADGLVLLDRIGPYFIIVYGTGIIGKSVMVKVKCGSLNMHAGLAPWYRGSNTIFWALYDEEPENAAVTTPILSQRVDAGAVLHTAPASIESDDDEDMLFAKAVRIGTPLLIRGAREVADGTATAIPQDLSVGREHRFVDRTAASERPVARLRRSGLPDPSR